MIITILKTSQGLEVRSGRTTLWQSPATCGLLTIREIMDRRGVHSRISESEGQTLLEIWSEGDTQMGVETIKDLISEASN